tara:strand:- start:8143 stop:8340 length:198 start_codon:yes stop_codon:yes gene_type:complete
MPFLLFKYTYVGQSEKFIMGKSSHSSSVLALRPFGELRARRLRINRGEVMGILRRSTWWSGQAEP